MKTLAKYWKKFSSRLHNDSSEQLLDNAILHITTGNPNEGRKILKGLLERNKGNELAWYWLSKTLKKDKEIVACLEKVVALNPENFRAQDELRGLRV